MTKPNAKEAEIAEWLASQQEAMLSLLGDAVNIDSGSYDKAGVDAIGDLFIDFFSPFTCASTIRGQTRSPWFSWAIAIPFSPRAKQGGARFALRTAVRMVPAWST